MEGRGRADVGIDIWELPKELFHGKDDGKNTLVETKEQATHTSGKGGNQNKSTAEYIFEACRRVSTRQVGNVGEKRLLTVAANCMGQCLTVCHITSSIGMELNT